MKYLVALAAVFLVSAPAYADSLGSAVGGSPANQSSLGGGICQTAPVALSNGQQAGLLIDCTTHALITEGGGSGGTSTVQGGGVAGTPATGVVTVQGISGGTDQAISIDQTTPSTTNGVVVNPTSVAGAAIVPVVAQGVSTLLGKASAGNLYTVYATATADSWLMVFNSTSAPTNGSTTAGTASGNLQDCVKVPSGTTTSIGGLPMPERFSVGIYYAISSTACATLTLATTAFIKGMQQ